jgi:hypothetical protein
MICVVCTEPIEDGARYIESNVHGAWHEDCKPPGSETGTYYLQSGETLRGFPANAVPHLDAKLAPPPRAEWEPQVYGEIRLENLTLGGNP